MEREQWIGRRVRIVDAPRGLRDRLVGGAGTVVAYTEYPGTTHEPEVTVVMDGHRDFGRGESRYGLRASRVQVIE